ncbi:MAG: GNAT family N-acetyltransferase [Sphingomonadales bacterium]|nr:GNAT family N-acetyltransferase [Sphingomonadales bacterium]
MSSDFLTDRAGTSRPAAQLCTVRVSVARDRLLDLEFGALWDVLAARASEPNPFCERWYLDPALNAFDQKSEVALIELWSGAHLVGLMPTYRETRYAGLPIATTQNWLNANAFLGTPLIEAGFEAAFWDAVLQHCDAARDAGLFFHCTGLVRGGPIATALEAICAAQNRRYGLVFAEERALLESGMAPQVYYEAHVRGKKRKELRRQQNRLSELGKLEFERSDGANNLNGWIDEFLALERRGWKGANGSALACAADTTALFRNALQGAAQAGKLELLALRLDGRAIAMLVTFLCLPGSFSFKTAFDEDHARFSPGVLLQIENLKLLEKAGLDWCDSCAAQDHPMIDSLWGGRRTVGRWSVAIGGPARRMAFATLLKAEKAKSQLRKIKDKPAEFATGDEA